MRKTVFISLFLLITFFEYQPLQAQSHELQQLLLNLEKLRQFRAILDNMQKGYQIISKGYTTIKDLSEGNFSLHKDFLDRMLEVSPTVKKYQRIGAIIQMQRSLIKESKETFGRLQTVSLFAAGDLDYFRQIYDNLLGRSIKNLEELTMVITSRQVRMNDAERLNAIDRIYKDMEDKLKFLRHFNDKTSVLAVQKHKALQETRQLKTLYQP